MHDTPTTHDGHDPITLAAAATDRMNKLGMKARRGIPDSEVRRTKATRDKYMKKSMPMVSDGRSNKKQNWVPKYQDETQTRTSNDLGPYFSHPKGLLDNAHNPKPNNYYCERLIKRDIALVDQPAKFGMFSSASSASGFW